MNKLMQNLRGRWARKRKALGRAKASESGFELSSARPAPTSAPYLLLLLFVALVLLWVAETLFARHPTYRSITEHTASAFIAAAIIASTYEYLLHNHREAMFKRLFYENQQHMFKALKVHLLLTPEEIFRLL